MKGSSYIFLRMEYGLNANIVSWRTFYSSLWCIALLMILSSCHSVPEPITGVLTPDPTWAPHCGDEERDANFDPKWWHIFRYEIATGEHTQLTNGQVDDTSPTFSPDGKELAFVRNGCSIQVLDIGRREVKLILDHEGRCSELKWSPNGERLAFVADWTSMQQVYVMNADGTDVNRLTQRNTAEAAPAWSPDGDQILYYWGCPCGSENIGVINVGSSEKKRTVLLGVDQTGHVMADPAWTADSEGIVYSRATCIP